MQEKLKLLLIGSIFSVMTVFVTSYFNGYALKAETLKQFSELEKKVMAEKAERRIDIAVINQDLKYLKEGQKELKDLLKEAIKTR